VELELGESDRTTNLAIKKMMSCSVKSQFP